MESGTINKKLGDILQKITGLPKDKNNNVYLYNDWGYVEFTLQTAALFRFSNKFEVTLNASVRITLIENHWDDKAELLKIYTPSDFSVYKNNALKK